MKIEMGKQYKTIKGAIARPLAINLKSGHPVVMAVRSNNSLPFFEFAGQYTLDGVALDGYDIAETIDAVNIEDSDLALPIITHEWYPTGTAIDALTLPEATGGTGTLDYTLQPLPDGLSFDVDSRTLTGTPTTEDFTDVCYTAMDRRGNYVQERFSVFINKVPDKHQPLMKWQRMTDVEFRMPVFGGWIFRKEILSRGERHLGESTCFIPDPNHDWKID